MRSADRAPDAAALGSTSGPAAAADAVLVVDRLTRRFGDRVAVDGVSFHVAPGETYGLLGPNGAGKSTTISVIAGLLDAHQGTVTVAGRPITPDATAAKAAIGLVPQDLAIYPDLSVTENLDLFARLQGMDRRTRRSRIDEVLEVTALVDRRTDRADRLSGGMKRRLNIAAGLLHRPALLILDEPTVGVDPQSRNAILTSIEQLSVEGLAVLYTTHYMEEAERLCDRIGIVDGGRLLAEGTAAELARPIAEAGLLRIVARGVDDRVLDGLRTRPGVHEAVVDDDGLRVVVDDAGGRLVEVADALLAAGVAIESIAADHPDLETVFLHLTGKALRG